MESLASFGKQYGKQGWVLKRQTFTLNLQQITEFCDFNLSNLHRIVSTSLHNYF